MPSPYPELQGALGSFLDRVDRDLKQSGYTGEPVVMYLAGGLAVNYHCGSRYTGDIGASFSRRVLLPDAELVFTYPKRDGAEGVLYFDRNYNSTLALLHPDHEKGSREWEGLGNERRAIQLHVLSPLDLAVSKVARFSDQDREDIRSLAQVPGFSFAELQRRADEALGYFVGNQAPIRTSLALIERDLQSIQPSQDISYRGPRGSLWFKTSGRSFRHERA
mgnify:CR=1 FL=1